jgi:hypothetical protein
MGLSLAGIPHTTGGVLAALDYMAQSAGVPGTAAETPVAGKVGMAR